MLTTLILFDIMIERLKVNMICECAGTGRQARLRGVCQPTYGFKSHHSHQSKNWFLTGSFLFVLIRDLNLRFFTLAVPDDSILPYLACRPRRFVLLASSSTGRARNLTHHSHQSKNWFLTGSFLFVLIRDLNTIAKQNLYPTYRIEVDFINTPCPNRACV